tara:strand:+ start:370 stop:531 length:162 start_codon:yes stop_codon:yes gene_type:complete
MIFILEFTKTTYICALLFVEVTFSCVVLAFFVKNAFGFVNQWKASLKWDAFFL